MILAGAIVTLAGAIVILVGATAFVPSRPRLLVPPLRRASLRRSGLAVTLAATLAAGCTGAPEAAPIGADASAPTREGRIAPETASESHGQVSAQVAPTSDRGIAPTAEADIAPTTETESHGDASARVARTSVEIAPTNDQIAPERAATAPTREAPVAPTTPFDGARAWEHLRRLVGFGPRPSGSPAIARTRGYIAEQLKASGLAFREQAFTATTPLGEVPMVNVIATIPGRRPDRLAIASHYDTKLFAFPFLGANDGGSSTAALLELGRVLEGRRNDLTIELLFLDGEEARRPEWQGTDNTYGSRHYVQDAQASGALRGLKALVLLDMIGDRDLTIRRDSNSTPWLVDIVWDAAARLGHSGTFSNQLTTVEDDHIPFLRAGVAAVDLIDLESPVRRGTWHTRQDTLDFVAQESLQTVGEVVLAALPDIERAIASRR